MVLCPILHRQEYICKKKVNTYCSSYTNRHILNMLSYFDVSINRKPHLLGYNILIDFKETALQLEENKLLHSIILPYI